MNVLPQNEEAEEAVLGIMLANSELIPRVMDVLEPRGEEKFFKPSHGMIYSVLRGLWAAGTTVDVITAAEAAESQGVLEKIGGRVRLAELAYLVTSTANVGHYAGIVREMWARRVVGLAGLRMYDAMKDPVDADVVLADAERELVALSDAVRRDKDGSVVLIGDLVESLIEDLQNPRVEQPGWSPPLPCMPRLVPGQVYVIAGYTGHGKTIIGTQITRAVCEQGGSVTFHSLEMSRESIRNRLVASFGVPLQQLNSGNVSDAFWPLLLEASGTMHPWRLRVIDDSSVLVRDVLRYQRALRSDVIVFDHLHQMELDARSGEHRLALDSQLRQFVSLAKSENVPVVLLAQLRRKDSLSGSPFPKPHLKDLKESGAIEQIASYVGFIWRQTDEDGVHSLEAEWVVGKNRNDAVVPSSRLVFDRSTVCYRQP